MAIELTGERADELIRLQTASDAAHAAVLEAPTPEAWQAWRDRAAEAQEAVTLYAKETGEPRNKVEAAVKKAVRHPEPAPEA
ncbi:hypothetical protein [Streptomyces xanthophaeus]|uniref:hypothetical protein n=1 Tax=Streptomyces xanthophaeus TaxID=67385 RepID=UPI00264830E3|nr:hypothetical protein [Streptomyces xanthophaeus]